MSNIAAISRRSFSALGLGLYNKRILIFKKPPLYIVIVSGLCVNSRACPFSWEVDPMLSRFSDSFSPGFLSQYIPTRVDPPRNMSLLTLFVYISSQRFLIILISEGLSPPRSPVPAAARSITLFKIGSVALPQLMRWMTYRLWRRGIRIRLLSHSISKIPLVSDFSFPDSSLLQLAVVAD